MSDATNATPEARAVRRAQRRADLRRAAEQAVELRRLKLDEILLRAYETGMLYVPPHPDHVEANCACLSCGATDYHAPCCRPPRGLRKLTLKEIMARDNPAVVAVPGAKLLDDGSVLIPAGAP